MASGQRGVGNACEIHRAGVGCPLRIVCAENSGKTTRVEAASFKPVPAGARAQPPRWPRNIRSVPDLLPIDYAAPNPHQGVRGSDRPDRRPHMDRNREIRNHGDDAARYNARRLQGHASGTSPSGWDSLAHHESRNLPVYLLILAKGGSRLKPSAGPGAGDTPGNKQGPTFSAGQDGCPALPLTYQ